MTGSKKFLSPVAKIFIILFLLQIILNMDQGLFPAASDLIRKDLNINDEQFGLMGSVVYVGLIVGSLISGPLLSKIKSKTIIVLTITLFLICMSFYIFVKNFIVLTIARVLSGFF